MFNQAFLGDGPYLRPSNARLYPGDSSILPDLSRSVTAVTPVSASVLDASRKLPGAHSANSSDLDVASAHRPWTSGNSAPRPRSNSPYRAALGHGALRPSVPLSDHAERPNTSHGPQSKPWASSHSVDAQSRPANSRPNTPPGPVEAPVTGSAWNSPQATPKPQEPQAPQRPQGPPGISLHNARSLSDNDMSTSSSVPTEASALSAQTTSPADDQTAVSLPSTASSHSPQLQSPQPVWPLLGGSKYSVDDLSTAFSESSSFGDAAQLAINEAANRPAPETENLANSPILTPTPLNPRSQPPTQQADGSQQPRDSKARDAAKQKDLSIEVPRRRSWTTQIDLLERSWLEEQAKPGQQETERQNFVQSQSAPYDHSHHFPQQQQQLQRQRHQPNPNSQHHQDYQGYPDYPDHPNYQDNRHHASQHPQRGDGQPYSPRFDSLQDQHYDGRPSPQKWQHQQRYQNPHSNTHDGAHGRGGSQGYSRGAAYPGSLTEKQPSPGMPTSSKSTSTDMPYHYGRQIGRDFDDSPTYTPHSHPLRGAKSMQNLKRTPRDSREYHNSRGLGGFASHAQTPSPYSPRGSSMASSPYGAPAPAPRNPRSGNRNDLYTLPSRPADTRYPGHGPNPRTRAPQHPPYDPGAYRDPMQYGRRGSPRGSPQYPPPNYYDYTEGYSSDHAAPPSRAMYAMGDNRSMDSLAIGAQQPRGPPRERDRHLRSISGSTSQAAHLFHNPSVPERQLSDVAEDIDAKDEMLNDTEVKDFAFKERSPTDIADRPSTLEDALPLTPVSPIDEKTKPNSSELQVATTAPSIDLEPEPTVVAAVPEAVQPEAAVEDSPVKDKHRSQPPVEELHTPPGTPPREREELQLTESPIVDGPALSSYAYGRPVTPEKREPVHPQITVGMGDDSNDGSNGSDDDGEQYKEAAELAHIGAVDWDPPLSPRSLLSQPTGDAEPSTSANWPLPSFVVSEPAPATEAPLAAFPKSPLPRLPLPLDVSLPTSPVSTAPVSPVSSVENSGRKALDGGNGGVDEDNHSEQAFYHQEPQPSPTKSKSAFTASVYAQDIGLGPYAFDSRNSVDVGSLGDRTPESPAAWTFPERRDSQAPQQVSGSAVAHAAAQSDVSQPEAGTPSVEAEAVHSTSAADGETPSGASPAMPTIPASPASPESHYSWGGGGHFNEPALPPESIGLARGPSILETDRLPRGASKKRWNIASHDVDSERLHERIASGGQGHNRSHSHALSGSMASAHGSPPALGHSQFDRHTPTGIVDSFGTTFI